MNLIFPLREDEKKYLEPFKKAVPDIEDLVNEVINVYHFGFIEDPYIPLELDLNLPRLISRIMHERAIMQLQDFWIRYLDKEYFSEEKLLIIIIPHILQDIEGSLKNEISYIGYNLFRIRGNNEKYHEFMTKYTPKRKLNNKNFMEIIVDSKKFIPKELPFLKNIFSNLVDQDFIIRGKRIKFTQFRNCLAHSKYEIKKVGDDYFLLLDNNGELISIDIINELSTFLSFRQLTMGLRACNHIALNRYIPRTGIDIKSYGV